MVASTRREPARVSSYNVRHVFAWALAVRLLNSLVLSTFFQPDEFYQSLEPAWDLAFGKESGAWITWEWRHQLRSSLHPSLFAGTYIAADAFAKLARLSPQSRAQILLAAPKLLQAAFAACIDLFTVTLARKVFGIDDSATWITLSLSLLSPWNFFCSVRTLSNSLETSLTAVALSLWPVPNARLGGIANRKKSSGGRNANPSSDYDHPGPLKSVYMLRVSLILAALATCLRPTNVLVWAPLGLQLLIAGSPVPRLRVLTEAALCGSLIVFLTTLLDRWYYGIWTFPPLRFLYFNINQDLAVFYGKNRWDYYLTEGLPLLLTTALPFALIGMYQTLKSTGQKQERSTNAPSFMAWIAVFFTLCLSLISHKEVRFLFPLLPVFHVITVKPLLRFMRARGNVKRLCFGIIVVLNLVISLYTTQVHQRGVIDVIHFLRSDHEARMTNQTGFTTVGFLMPCHSTPWRSHLIHGDIHAWALTCEPPLDVPLESRHLYLDEADKFYADPIKWINEEMIDGKDSYDPDNMTIRHRVWPERVVFFQQLLPVIEEILKRRGYRQCWRGFNSHWHDDWRRKGDVLVWCKQLNSN